MEIVAYVVSDAAGYYVARYVDEDAAYDHAAEHEGWAVGAEWPGGSVTFDFIPPD